MNFENLGDKVIDDQGNVKTFSSGQDARLYYLDFEGNTKKYLLEGEAAGGGGGELPENLVTSVNGQTGDVTLDIPEIPGNIVNSINGETGDVTIDIPELPANLVNSFNGQTKDVEYMMYMDVDNESNKSMSFAFNQTSFPGVIFYFKNPISSLELEYLAPNSNNIASFRDKYAIVRTGENFTGVTVILPAPTTAGLSEWITNKEFVMEPNKVYLIGCTYPLATIIELENVK